MRRLSPLLLGSYAATFATLVSAHPGNHSADVMATVWHMLTQGDHVFWLAASLLASLLLVRVLHRRALSEAQGEVQHDSR